MTQEDKDLLLRDLCARLPYGVKGIEANSMCLLNTSAHFKSLIKNIEYKIGHLGFKPYLFPLSSMTEEQTEEVHNLIYQGVSESVDETKEWLKIRKENELRPITLTYILSYRLVIDWFCKNHFDYRGLIPKGLAIDCTNLNIY